MNVHDMLMGLCLIGMSSIIMKGLWGITYMRPLEQPDSAQSGGAPPAS
jgi:hypothetical protein